MTIVPPLLLCISWRQSRLVEVQTPNNNPLCHTQVQKLNHVGYEIYYLSYIVRSIKQQLSIMTISVLFFSP